MAEQAPQAPASPAELFSACMQLAMQGFGGVLPVAQRELVERRRWLSRDQFLALLSMAQVLPGPNIINLVLMLGDRHFGWRGAAAALGGILLAPLALVLMLAALVGQFDDWPAVAGALRGMGVVAAGLVLSTAAKLSRGLGRNPLGPWGCAGLALLTTLAVGLLRWPLVWVVLGLGSAACMLAWRKLKP